MQLVEDDHAFGYELATATPARFKVIWILYNNNDRRSILKEVLASVACLLSNVTAGLAPFNLC